MFEWITAGKMDLPMVQELMTHYPIIVWATGPMLFFVLLEYLIGEARKQKLYRGRIFWPSVGVGLGNLLFSEIAKLLGVLSLVWLVYYYLAPFQLPNVWWTYPLCFIALDFARYWAHRIAHENRFWWATHVTHHSGEDYNFSVSFRLSWVQHIKIIFFLPVALLGFDPIVFFICHQVAVLYQYTIHTELVRKMPRIIEYIFVTPSHHRVHHGTNPKYIDRNYGSSLIIWDRMFGTFQPEEEKANYGITTPMRSLNPITLVFHEWVDIYKDCIRTKSFKEFRKALFGAPGTYIRSEWENGKYVGEQKTSPMNEQRPVSSSASHGVLAGS